MVTETLDTGRRGAPPAQRADWPASDLLCAEEPDGSVVQGPALVAAGGNGGGELGANAHALAQSDVFSVLDHQALLELARQTWERTYRPGQVIASVAEPCRAVHLIVRGKAQACRLSAAGREYVFDDYGAGESPNLAAALDGRMNMATVTALTTTTTCVIPVEAFRQAVSDNAQLTMAVVQHLAHRVRRLSDTVEDLALCPVSARVARWLLDSTEGGTRPVQPWTQQDIAARIGSVRDVVGRTLRAYLRQGLIGRERGWLEVLDVAGLRQEALCNAR
jgi:CRP/FNR family cyclic AMP-dependent transcriptional regulator